MQDPIGQGAYGSVFKGFLKESNITVALKKTKIEKSFEPGPGSYHYHGTVGVIPEYNRYEAYPREGSVKAPGMEF